MTPRLSLNTITCQPLSLPEAIDACARHGVGAIGVWRDKVAEVGVAEAAARIADAGLAVSSLCRGGLFTVADAAERHRRIDDSRRAVEEAATLGADVLVLVVGGVVARDLPASRAMVADAVEALLPDAAAAGVRLGLEPLHPMFAGDRSVLTTLAEANDLCDALASPWLGVIVDAYHVWWDHRVAAEIARAGGSILGFHVSDWLAPPPDVLLGRGMMGDGCIDLAGLWRQVSATGYDGWVEVEIMNAEWWARPTEELLGTVTERFAAAL